MELTVSAGKKIFVLDTSVLISFPKSISAFDGEIVVLPIEVLEELDNLKTRQDEVGVAARYVNRFLGSIAKTGSLEKGILLDNEQEIWVYTEGGPEQVPFNMRDINDNRILAAALALHQKYPNVRFLTQDIALRVKGNSHGIRAEDYHNGREDGEVIESLYTGVSVVTMSPEDVSDFYENEHVDYDKPLNPNECIVLKGGQASALAISDGYGKIHKLRYASMGKFMIQGIQPRSKEQVFALELLLNPNISLVTLSGNAGSGKTILACAAAIEHIQKGRYEKIVITRPTISSSKDIGFLPGTKFEKMESWLQPFFDNFRIILGGDRIYVNKMIENGRIEVEALTFIRGRTFPNTLLIVDESQNMTLQEAKALLTRMGENSKIILLGDLNQIDSAKLDSSTSGLGIIIEKFKDFDLSGHITLIKGERSALATHAAKIL